MKKVSVITMGIGLLLLVVFGIYFAKMRTSDNPSGIVDVDEIVRHPERFKRDIGVVGKVTKVDESNTSFVLGCDDACVVMPVRYGGQMPELGSEIVVYGEIEEAEGGRYIFAGREVQAR